MVQPLPLTQHLSPPLNSETQFPHLNTPGQYSSFHSSGRHSTCLQANTVWLFSVDPFPKAHSNPLCRKEGSRDRLIQLLPHAEHTGLCLPPVAGSQEPALTTGLLSVHTQEAPEQAQDPRPQLSLLQFKEGESMASTATYVPERCSNKYLHRTVHSGTIHNRRTARSSPKTHQQMNRETKCGPATASDPASEPTP